MTDFGKDVGRWSGGRLAFDARRRRLTLYGEDGAVLTEVEVGETQLRNWLQRLLLATPQEGGREPQEGGREPQELAILLLLSRLEAGERPGGDATGAGPGPGPAPVRRIC